MLNRENFEKDFCGGTDSDESGTDQNDLTKMAEAKAMEIDTMKPGEAYRTRDDKADHQPVDQYPATQQAIQDVIVKLNDLTKASIQNFFPEQYKSVLGIVRQSFTKRQNESMLLLGRSKMTLRALTLRIEHDIRQELGGDEPQEGEAPTLRVIRLNSALHNSENKIQAKFCDALGLKDANEKSLTGIEMQQKVVEYFEENPQLSVLFIFEDIDYYIETTKQIMLYKILDSMTATKISFCFLTTSSKSDVVDGFEKRIKSRFSHRSEMFYYYKLEDFLLQVESLVVERKELAEQAGDMPLVLGYAFLEEAVKSGVLKDTLTEYRDNGRDIHYLTHQIKIALSYVNQKLTETVAKGRDDPAFTIQIDDCFEYLKYLFRSGVATLEQIQSNREYSTVLINLPKAQIIVLIIAYKRAQRGSLFNFEGVYSLYMNYMKNHLQQMEIKVTSRAQFLKLFLDLIDKGFLKTESEDILNVNTKIALGFSQDDFSKVLLSEKQLNKMGLPQAIHALAKLTK